MAQTLDVHALLNARLNSPKFTIKERPLTRVSFSSVSVFCGASFLLPDITVASDRRKNITCHGKIVGTTRRRTADRPLTLSFLF